MTRDLYLEDVLSEIVTLIRDFLDCDSCLIYLVEDGQLVLSASTDETRGKIGQVRLRMSEGLTGWVARERRLVSISQEAYRDPRFKFFKDLPQDTFEAFLSVPIISQSKVVGVINVQFVSAARTAWPSAIDAPGDASTGGVVPVANIGRKLTKL